MIEVGPGLGRVGPPEIDDVAMGMRASQPLDYAVDQFDLARAMQLSRALAIPDDDRENCHGRRLTQIWMKCKHLFV
jgi:hypothetical protein